MMCNPGVKEKQKSPRRKTRPEQNMKGPWLGNLATFHDYRAKGAPIGFAPDPRTGHECGDSRYLAIPFLDACLATRLPEKDATDQTLKPVDMSKAWLAPLMGDEPRPAAEFQGDPKEAVWLPNEAVAKAWAEYVKTGSSSDTTPPPAPYHVKASPKGDRGMEDHVEPPRPISRVGIRGFRRVARRSRTGRTSPKTRWQVRTPVVPEHDMYLRHSGSTDARNALPRYVGQSR